MEKKLELNEYKIVLSWILGALSLIFVKYKSTFYLGNFSINLVWSLILPLLVALSYGFKFAVISIFGGFVFIYPFLIGYNNGWASLVPSLSFIIWILLHGHGRDKREEKNSFFNNIYFLQFLSSLIRVILYLVLFEGLIELNPPRWNEDAVRMVSKNIIILFAIKGAIMDSILLSVADILLLLKPVRKIFKLNIEEKSQDNERILFSIILLGLVYTSLILLFNGIILMQGDFVEYIGVFLDTFKVNIIFAIFLFFIMGGISVKYLEKVKQGQIDLKKSEEKYKEIAEELNSLNLNLENIIKERTLELEYAVKQLEEYSYVISHDLKTPLRAIDGYVEFIMEDYREENIVDEENLYNIRRIARDNILLIERLLDYSMTFKKELIIEKINFMELLLNIFEDFKTGEDLNMDLELDMDPFEKIQGDVVLISQVISNIISNSVKFRKKDGKLILQVMLLKEEENYLISFEDNGVGFNMKYSDKVFGIFERMHSEKDYTGMGIGLAVIKTIVQKHKGEVWIDSREEEGTKISIRLPIL